MKEVKLSDVERCLLNQYEESIVGDFDFSFYFSDKQCHIQLWNKIAEILPEYFEYYRHPSSFKELALDLLGFYEKVTNNCYACDVATTNNHSDCGRCPLGGICCNLGWEDFTNGLYGDRLGLAIKGAKALAEAWGDGE